MVAPDLGDMQADATKTRQMLLNLLSNASKFTEKGTVTLVIQAVGKTTREMQRDLKVGDRIKGALSPWATPTMRSPTLMRPPA